MIIKKGTIPAIRAVIDAINNDTNIELKIPGYNYDGTSKIEDEIKISKIGACKCFAYKNYHFFDKILLKKGTSDRFIFIKIESKTIYSSDHVTEFLIEVIE